jgi:hypothetical protein
MKTTLPLLAALLCLSPLQSARAAGRRVDNVQPKVTLIGSPEIVAQIKGGTPKRPRVPAPGEPAPIWLEFESDFDSAEDFPELVFKYSLLLKTSQSLKLLEGEVTLVDVARGKDRHSVVYIAPKTLNRLSEGKPFNPNNIQAFWVEVGAQGEAVGAQFKSTHGITYDQVAKEKDKLETLKDVFLAKSQTPFAPLFWDYYETVKPIAR